MFRITSELANVLLHPLQSFDLIFETIVGASAFDNLVGCEESIRSNAVVEVYNDNIVVACLNQTGPVVVGVGVCVESTTLDEKVDGERVVRSGIRGSKDVYEKTILG
jgi:hypothetical protein